jgi:hypothetical protein
MHDAYLWFNNQLQNNDVFSGVIGGSVAASLLFSLRSLPYQMFLGLRWIFFRFCTVEVTLTNADLHQYTLIVSWLNTVVGDNSNKVHLDFALQGSNSGVDPDEDFVHAHVRSNAVTTLGYGSFGFWYKGIYVRVNRSREEDKTGAELRKSEILKLRFWTRKRNVLEDIIAASKADAPPRIYISKPWGAWSASNLLTTRSIDTVILPAEQKSRILKDLEWFFENKNFYNQLGLSCSRGYLFYGPPGTGKTTLVRSLASYFKKNLFVISLADVDSDSSLLQLVVAAQAGSFIVIDDIDLQGVVTNRDADTSTSNGAGPRKVTLGGLLQVLDGIHAGSDHVIFLVTNRPEALDSALIRPGRIDLCEKIDLLSREDGDTMASAYFDVSYVPCLDALTFPTSGAEIEQVLLQEFKNRGVSRNEVI